MKYFTFACCMTLILAACSSEPPTTPSHPTTRLSTAAPTGNSTQDVRKPEDSTFQPSAIQPTQASALATQLGDTESIGDANNGKVLVGKKCAMCHYLDQAKAKVGPSLQGIYERKPSIEGVPFTTWNDDALNQWLTNPKAVKANTRMGFPGFKNAQDRADAIAYLQTL